MALPPSKRAEIRAGVGAEIGADIGAGADAARQQADRSLAPMRQGVQQQRSQQLQQRMVALFALALMLFNFPLLALWDRDATVWGLPLFPSALFLVWALLIAALAWLMERAAD